MRIHNATFEVKRRGDGSAVFVLHHGGDRLVVELSNEDRLEMGRMFLEPLYECVPCETAMIEEVGP